MINVVGASSLNRALQNLDFEHRNTRYADCDDLAVCSELVLNFEKYEYFV